VRLSEGFVVGSPVAFAVDFVGFSVLMTPLITPVDAVVVVAFPVPVLGAAAVVVVVVVVTAAAAPASTKAGFEAGPNNRIEYGITG
jgi:hypothetical protein